MNTDPTTDNDYASIDPRGSPTAACGAFTNGGAVAGGLPMRPTPGFGAPAATLGYGRGATLAIAQASPDRTVTDTSTLYFDSSLNGAGASSKSCSTIPPTAKRPIPLYRSLQAANANHNPVSSPTWWTANGYVYPAWSSATLYALADLRSPTRPTTASTKA
jgi:hypothetical protein